MLRAIDVLLAGPNVEKEDESELCDVFTQAADSSLCLL